MQRKITRQRKWQIANRAKHNAYRRKYIKANRAKVSGYRKKWRHKVKAGK